MKQGKNVERMARLWNLLLQTSRFPISSEKLKGASWLDVQLLYRIKEQPMVTIKELVHSLGLTNSTLGSAVKRLEKKQLIMRNVCQEDLRTYSLSLTSEGEKVVRENMDGQQSLMGALLGRFTQEEEERFLGLLEKLVLEPGK